MEEFDVCITCCKFYEKSSRVSIKNAEIFAHRKFPKKRLYLAKKSVIIEEIRQREDRAAKYIV